MAALKAWAEDAEAHQIVEENIVTAAAARCRAVLVTMEAVAEELEMEQDDGLPSKQKGQVEGEQRVSRGCVTAARCRALTAM